MKTYFVSYTVCKKAKNEDGFVRSFGDAFKKIEGLLCKKTIKQIKKDLWEQIMDERPGKYIKESLMILNIIEI